MNSLDRSIKDHEGFKQFAYLDTNGFLTVGIGHKLTNADIKAIKFSKAKIKRLYKIDKEKAIKNAKAVLGLGWDNLYKYQQEVMIEMAYQLGRTGLSKFKNMIKAIKAGNLELAVIEMMDSQVARKQPRRYKALSKKIRGIA